MPLFKRDQVSWPVLLIEMIVIMVSVVLGFALNEWRQDRAQMEAVDHAKGVILTELEQNLRHTEQRQAYYETMADTLAVMAEREGDAAPLGPDVWEVGVEPLFFRTGGYETARATGALSNMDFDVLEAVVTAYHVQEGYEAVAWRISEWQFDERWGTVGRQRILVAGLLNPELPRAQALAVRMLQGDDREEAERRVDDEYGDNAGS